MLLRKFFVRKLWIPVLFTILGAISAGISGFGTDAPATKEIIIRARQYAYDPPKIIANIGDTLHLKLVSMDVVHGFFLEGYDVDAEIYPGVNTFKIRKPSEGYTWEDTEELTVILNRRGKFRYRCSHTCGSMHPFMQGELIVNPNTPYHAGLGGIAGFTIGLLLMMSSTVKGLRISHSSSENL